MFLFMQAAISEFVAVDGVLSQNSIFNICKSAHKHVSSLHDSLTWHCIFIINFTQLPINFTAVTTSGPQNRNPCTHFHFGCHLYISKHDVYDWLSEKLNLLVKVTTSHDRNKCLKCCHIVSAKLPLTENCYKGVQLIFWLTYEWEILKM